MKITAQIVPWSSVLGTGLLLLDEAGKAVGQLALMNVQYEGDRAPDATKAHSLALVELVATAINSKASFLLAPGIRPLDKAEFEEARNYLGCADAHADEGPLGEAAARSILVIAERLCDALAPVFDSQTAPREAG